MASLTPGVLSKLLHNLHDPAATVAGCHRSALLQVIGIVPRGDVFDSDRRGTGFYLRVSDSLHAAYVSVPQPDAELVLGDKIQLGQFVHVTRLDSGSPVPVLRGVKPVPRRRPCVGDPKDLISSDVLLVRGDNGVGFSRKTKKNEGGGVRRLSLADGKTGDGFQRRRLSLDCPSRKAWDRSPAPAPAGKARRSGSDSGSRPKEPSSPLCATPVCPGKKASSEKDLVLKPPNSNVPPLKNKNVIVSQKPITKPIQKDSKPSFDSTAKPSRPPNMPVGVKTWPGSKVSWDFVSPTIRRLGKEVICRRDVGFSMAVRALEETSATESVLQCMSAFAEVCELAETSTSPVVERFLNLHHKIRNSLTKVNSLLDPKSTDEIKVKPDRENSARWVRTALETNLANFTLFAKHDDKNIENHHYVVLENGQSPETKRDPVGPRDRTERAEWSEGDGLRAAAKLAERLLAVSRKWFVKYLEGGLLDDGFGSVGVGLIGQLKRVNQWLDGSAGDGTGADPKVEELRKKLYGFLLHHVQKGGV